MLTRVKQRRDLTLLLLATACHGFADAGERGAPAGAGPRTLNAGAGGRNATSDSGGNAGTAEAGAGAGGEPARPGDSKGGSDGAGSAGKLAGAAGKATGAAGKSTVDHTSGGRGAAGGGASTGADGGLGGLAGDNGTAGDASAAVEPPLYGAVRVFVDGTPICGGTLLTNSWVLTADHCIPAAVTANRVSIALGSDSLHPQQLQQALELQRFPGNVGEQRVRDLALLGVDAPFELDGDTTSHSMELWPFEYWGQGLQAYRCAGWDLEPDPASPTDRLRVVDLSPTAQSTLDDGEAVIWWSNSDPFDPEHGVLPMPADDGSGCVIEYARTLFLEAVQAGNPALTHDGQPNAADEAYALNLGPSEIQSWIDGVLFEALPETALDLAGHVSACSFDPDSVDLFGRRSDGQLGWYRREARPEQWQSAAAQWAQRTVITPPPNQDLAADQPGILCWPNGDLEIAARTDDGALWWRHYAAASAGFGDWEQVAAAGNDVASGVSLVGLLPGTFYAFARGTDAQLHHATYSDGWRSDWSYLSRAISGAPSVSLQSPEFLFGTVRDAANVLYDVNGWLTGLAYGKHAFSVTSDPTLTSGRPGRLDSFSRIDDGNLWHWWYDGFWTPNPSDTGIAMPDGEPAAVARRPGRLDVFVAEPGSLWHVVWPRGPRP